MKEPRKKPLVSIIVPTFNRAYSLDNCLTSLARSDYPTSDFEVIVVDDGSTRRSDDVVGAYSGKLNIRMSRQKNKGAPAARNLGARIAEGRFLAFTDDDCRVAGSWLGALVSALVRNPGSLVGGRVLNGAPDDCYAVAVHLVEQHLYEHYNSRPGAAAFFGCANMGVSRDLFLRAGGFDSTFTKPLAAEDRDFCDRWTHLGRPISYQHEAVVYHDHRYGFTDYLKRNFRDGIGAKRLRRARKVRGLGSGLEGDGFYLGILTRPWKTFPKPQALKLSLMINTSQAVVLAGYLYECIAGSVRGMPGDERRA